MKKLLLRIRRAVCWHQWVAYDIDSDYMCCHCDAIKHRKRKDTLTCTDLIKVLKQARREYGDYVPIYFDTEARKFNYHMAHVSRAYSEMYPVPHVSLHEKFY